MSSSNSKRDAGKIGSFAYTLRECADMINELVSRGQL